MSAQRLSKRHKVPLDQAKGFSPNSSAKRQCVEQGKLKSSPTTRSGSAIQVRDPASAIKKYQGEPLISSDSESEAETSLVPASKAPTEASAASDVGPNAEPMDIDDEDEDELAVMSLQVTPKDRPKTKKYVVGGANSDDESDAQPSPSKRTSARNANVLRQVLSEKPVPPVTRRSTSRTPSRQSLRTSPEITKTASLEEIETIAPRTYTPTKSKLSQVETPTRASKRLDKVFEKVARPLKQTVIPDVHPSAEQVASLKSQILAKVNAKQALPLMDLDKPYESVHALLKETIERAESNSALLLGPTASGKSVLIKEVLSDLREAEEPFITVHLDGNIHTDDRMALRALARQLQPDSEPDSIANADMMTALLAILSHPSEFGEDGQALSIVLILDHFERFTQHHRQVLLYNLFDIAQSKKAPVCVIGLTAQVDAYEMLEKRVKSRFSHRIIQMAPPNTLDSFQELCLAGLTCEGDETVSSAYQEAWNAHMKGDAQLARFMAYVYYTSKDPRQVFARLALPLAQQISETTPFLEFSKFIPTLDHQPSIMPLSQGKNELILGCSMIELALLIASCRLEIKHQKISFATSYDEYATLAHRTSTAQRAEGVVNVRVWSKKLARGAWGRLEGAGLVVPLHAKSAATTGASEFAAVRCEVHLMALQVMLKETTLIKHAMQTWLRL
ncbi:origin recognition complex subunit 4 C-terminus-domain-containing protein [Protomyces lactucae-debilis]|uniref:Origin recognition complex subunit 4 C-terminus-domain-containing protein n=1 Tax=Protomyces lactucae-debilis TaxID=2754530 RepID=A0A1Y2FFB6_PROLT|nr:origin recognition complex subunit 4 C-terminus-domain-containing protein [Protomyces lactucae-debilis]ORY82660.1 origin recognition complex subunit 4 C-terminus-domain-containing protein [Protomyces lactucae-debilis]